MLASGVSMAEAAKANNATVGALRKALARYGRVLESRQKRTPTDNDDVRRIKAMIERSMTTTEVATEMKMPYQVAHRAVHKVAEQFGLTVTIRKRAKELEPEPPVFDPVAHRAKRHARPTFDLESPAVYDRATGTWKPAPVPKIVPEAGDDSPEDA